MILFQIIFTIFIIIVLLKTISRFRGKEINFAWLLSWVIFWLLAEMVVLSPNVSDQLAHAVGIGRGADLVIYASLALLFFFFFRLLTQFEKQKREITKLTRKISLLEVKK